MLCADLLRNLRRDRRPSGSSAIKPHKVRYDLERRNPEFKQKMAEVLCVYREVKILKESAAASKTEPSDAVAIVSYDEKPGIQAIRIMAAMDHFNREPVVHTWSYKLDQAA